MSVKEAAELAEIEGFISLVNIVLFFFGGGKLPGLPSNVFSSLLNNTEFKSMCLIKDL